MTNTTIRATLAILATLLGSLLLPTRVGAHTIISFDETRSSGTGSTGSASVTGTFQSFVLGSAYESARAGIMTIDPGASFVAVPTLTEQSLVGDVFVSGLLAQAQDLSPAEQAVLLNFVHDGGAALIFGELATFLNAANSMMAPFDMAFDGDLFQVVLVVITDPSHPIADGPFGTVATFNEGFVTAISDLGPHGYSIATNPLGDTLAVIPPNALAPGSGPVVVYSDSSLFLTNSNPPYNFGDNEVIFMNTMAFLMGICGADVDGDNVVGISDFLLVLAQWGPCPPKCFADVDGDGEVGILDFLQVLAEWGPCP